MTPRQVLLFTGHVVDAPGRAPPRLPASRVPAAAAAIARVLDELGAGPADLALTQGAAGGDILFAEACFARGVPLQLLLPQAEPDFVEASVRGGADGAAWQARWLAVRDHAAAPPQVLAPGDGDIYERCNRWLLAAALAHGVGRLHGIALWDGAPGGTGGTAHMVDAVRAAGGTLHWIDTRTLADAA
ncbi:MAG: hypothetical protein JNM33_08815 [Rubrivivax sp.]|nr:hypothetical protein [Rubrivivax sp.]